MFRKDKKIETVFVKLIEYLSEDNAVKRSSIIAIQEKIASIEAKIELKKHYLFNMFDRYLYIHNKNTVLLKHKNDIIEVPVLFDAKSRLHLESMIISKNEEIEYTQYLKAKLMLEDLKQRRSMLLKNQIPSDFVIDKVYRELYSMMESNGIEYLAVLHNDTIYYIYIDTMVVEKISTYKVDEEIKEMGLLIA